MKRTYPYLSSKTKAPQRKKTAKNIHCQLCGHPVGPQETLYVLDIQVNWFRGDDEVAHLCSPCGGGTVDLQRVMKALRKSAAKEGGEG